MIMKMRKTGNTIVDQLAMEDINSAMAEIDRAKGIENSVKEAIRDLYNDYIESSGTDSEALCSVRDCGEDLTEVVVLRKKLAKEVYESVETFERIEAIANEQSVNKSKTNPKKGGKGSMMGRLVLGKSYFQTSTMVNQLKQLDSTEIELNKWRNELIDLISITTNEVQQKVLENELSAVEVELRMSKNKKNLFKSAQTETTSKLRRMNLFILFNCFVLFGFYLFM
jgi:hypothetical protein